jgi:hypothetical protein
VNKARAYGVMPTTGGINNEDPPGAAAAAAAAAAADIDGTPSTSATSNALLACGEGAMLNCVTDDTDTGTEINPTNIFVGTITSGDDCNNEVDKDSINADDTTNKKGTTKKEKKLSGTESPSIVIGTAASAVASSLSSLAAGAVRGRSSKLNEEERSKFVLSPKRSADVPVENDYDTDIINSDAALLQAEAKSLANNLMIQTNKIQKKASRTISKIINNNKNKNAAAAKSTAPTTSSSFSPSTTTTTTTTATAAANAHAFTKAMFSSSSSSNNKHDNDNNNNDNKDDNVVINDNDCRTTEIVMDDDEIVVAIHPFDEMNTRKDKFFSPSNPHSPASCVGCSSSVRFAAEVEDFVDDIDDDDNHNKATTRGSKTDLSPRNMFLVSDDVHTTTPTLSSSSSSYHNLSLDEMSKNSDKAEVNNGTTKKAPSTGTRIATVTVTGSLSSYGQASLLDNNDSDDNEPSNIDEDVIEEEEEVLNADEMIEMTEQDHVDVSSISHSSTATTTSTSSNSINIDVRNDDENFFECSLNTTDTIPSSSKTDSNNAQIKGKKPSGSSSLKRWASSRHSKKSNTSSSSSKKKKKIQPENDVNVRNNNDVSKITSFIREEEQDININDGFEIEIDDNNNEEQDQ